MSSDLPGRRNRAIDSLRGLLVLAVMLGHFSELTDRSSFLTWFGTGVRMPLFIGLTGYLFRLESARTMTLPRLTRRYYHRLLLPWIVALAVYLTVTHQIQSLTPFHALARPPYHFWFVPVMMVFIVLAAISRRSPLAMLGIAAPASILAMYLLGVGYATEQTIAWMPDRRFFIYPIYFFYGMWVARRGLDPVRLRAAAVLAPIGLLWWSSLYGRPDLLSEVAAGLIASMPLICLLPWFAALPGSIPLVAGVGRNSLFFYLWHPMAFGLWASAGVHGAPMLVLATLSLGLVWRLLADTGSLGRVLGLLPRRRSTAPMTTPDPVPVLAVATPEHAL